MSGPVANNIFKASGVIAAAAGGLNWDSTILTALTNLTVTVQNVGGANYYYINGVRQQTLNLLEGFTYKFDQSDSSNSGHPFRFSTTSGGTHSGGSEYTTGVTTSGTPGNAGAYTQIVVASGAPVLYYYCTNHNYMGGTANTVGETVEANRGYWIDTTSTTCTITLPSSAEKGDQIILVDYARTWGTNKIIIDSNGLNYQGDPDTLTVEYSTNGEVLNIVYSDGTKGWIPQDDDEVADAPSPPPLQKAIFAYGTSTSGKVTVSNLVNSSGVIGNDVTGVGSIKSGGGGASYGIDKAIFGFGEGSDFTAITNLVTNQGVIGNDVTGVGTARQCTACSYGSDRAVFAFGGAGGSGLSITNRVTANGVVGSDTAGVGTGRSSAVGTRYGGIGGGEAIVFGGYTGSANVAITNLIASDGVVASDTAAVSGVTVRTAFQAGSPYGGDKGIFAFGNTGSGHTAISNKVSNLGVMIADTSAVGTARDGLYGAPYGGDKGVFAYGNNASGRLSMKNLVSNQGIVAADVTGVGTARIIPMAAGYSTSA